jgi:hypothetical protein
LEVLDKALALGRTPDAVRALQRIQAQVEERLTASERLEPKQLDEVARSACTVANATRDASAVAWVMQIYPRANLVPGASVIEAIGQVAVAMRATMRPAIADLMEWVRVATDPNVTRSLEQVVAAMEAAEARGDPDQTTRNPVLS